MFTQAAITSIISSSKGTPIKLQNTQKLLAISISEKRPPIYQSSESSVYHVIVPNIFSNIFTYIFHQILSLRLFITISLTSKRFTATDILSNSQKFLPHAKRRDIKSTADIPGYRNHHSGHSHSPKIGTWFQTP